MRQLQGWCKGRAELMQKQQSIQQIVYFRKRSLHQLCDLHWLAANIWVQLKVLALIHKIWNDLAPAPLADSLFPFLWAGQLKRPGVRVLSIEVWVSGGSREERGIETREGGKKLHMLMSTSPWGYAVRTITSPECLKGYDSLFMATQWTHELLAKISLWLHNWWNFSEVFFIPWLHLWHFLKEW